MEDPDGDSCVWKVGMEVVHSGTLLPGEIATKIGELCENEEKYAVKPKDEYLN